jgi:beta-galactosidase
MNRSRITRICSVVAATWLALATITARAGRQESLDAAWKFTLGDPVNAQSTPFDDQSWQTLDVPHDWSIDGPFDKANPTGGAGAFLPTGIGWYRKHFSLAPADKGHRIFVDFDGVMANSTVYLNGHGLGRRPYGYVAFRYDLTDHLVPGGGDNVLCVRVDNARQPASRWYAGAGINRHVRLVIADPVHLDHHATFITTPTVAPNAATVRVQTTVVNDSDAPREVTVQASVHGPPGSAPDGAYAVSGESPAQTIAPHTSADVAFDVQIPWSPRLWDLDHPDLHTANVRVRSNGQTLDAERVPFGIRQFRFDPDTGFWLNGRNFKLKGVCLHEDASALGTAVPLSAWERRLAVLKTLGVNALRPSHNPFSSDFLSLCDRMGFVVMDEMFDCWTVAKNPYDYHLFFRDWSLKDTAATVRRDRNHPSIFLYSAGNEIHDTPKPDIAIPILKSLVAEFHKHDPTRPVTQALFRPNVSHDYDNGLADLLDVVGTNYRDAELLAAHQQKPSRKIIATENGHDRKNWLLMRDNPAHAGQFLWTGIDYLGESRAWPVVGAGSGLIDRTGFVKPQGRERQSWWSDQPMVFACRRVAPPARTPDDPGFEPLRRAQVQFPDWTPRSPEPHDETVEVYSNGPSVELKLNGRSLGSKPLNADASARTWNVPFEPGTLEAIASADGRVVATHALRTAGKPARILLASERDRLPFAWADVAYVTATVVDENGTPVPTANDVITFGVTGPGAIAAVDSADNASHEPFHAPHRRAYQGRCVAILKSTAADGQITVTAAAPGLAGGTATLTATAPADPVGIP